MPYKIQGFRTDGAGRVVTMAASYEKAAAATRQFMDSGLKTVTVTEPEGTIMEAMEFLTLRSSVPLNFDQSEQV